MANHVLLNNVEHKDLRIITTRSAEFGDRVMSALTFPDEFRSVQAHYPIFFGKSSDTGGFQPLAMFGFEKDENLFLTGDGWDATYVPLSIERQPFLIGFQQRTDVGGVSRQMVIHVDMDHPRISQEEGERVFLEHGGYTDYLNRMNDALFTIHEGYERNKGFVQALLDHDLLESFTLDVELNDGSKHRLAGFYTINEEKLGELDADVLAKLSNGGFLLPIYMVVASMSNIRELIRRRNALVKG